MIVVGKTTNYHIFTDIKNSPRIYCMGGVVMFKIFLLFLALVPMMLGLAELIHILKLRILKPKNPIISYRVVILTNNMPLEHMRYVTEQYLWYSGKNSAKPVFINSLLKNLNILSQDYNA